jgi:hypothetical protein
LSHCVSEEMIADFFTKPIQGKMFKVIRDMILNLTPSVDHRSVLVNSTRENAQLKRVRFVERFVNRLVICTCNLYLHVCVRERSSRETVL